ncbi:DUF11 domain-containing protein [Luteolibacter ambystomatis]|uniref:DUF11 domain-containing protein n=1 Tax=Luteolibacter ambystomatis TaxID=2824561 RepID=A0A975J167_9BACT|nr:putative Ig domain-containing protein [Luteolibacter ambystomatis]QUE52130.1 DUF11 domain-containing protein [Luteolibacter ambystomatis]
MTPMLRLPRAAVLSAIAALTVPGLVGTLHAAPVVSATKDDGVPQTTRKKPGETITYTNTITNSGDATANGVSFSDPDVPGTTLSVSPKVTPIAFDDAYTLEGNTPLAVNAAAGVLANDSDPDGTQAGLTAVGLDVTGTQGAVVLNADGSFTFTPNVGYSGTTSFKYLAHDPQGLDSLVTGTVTLTVTAPIWWVNSAAAGGGNGTYDLPFQTVAAASTAHQANQKVFVYESGTAYTSGITLKNGAILIGEGDGITVNGITIAAGTAPTINNSGGTVVTLGTGNTIKGVILGTSNLALSGASYGTLTVSNTTINNSAGAAISLNGGGGTLVFMSVTSGGGTNGVSLTSLTGGSVTINGGAISGASGAAFSISGGLETTTYNGTITQNNAAAAVSVINRNSGSPGAVSFGGAITASSSTATAINLTGNSNGTVAFTGGLDLTTTSGVGFNATGGGTVSATQNNSTIVNKITTQTGTALNVANTNIGASNLTFRSINAGTAGSGPANGIVLNATGTNGGLTVTGLSNALASGGTIQKTTGTAVALTSTKNLSLACMDIKTSSTFGIQAGTIGGSSTTGGVNGLTLDRCRITANGTTNTHDGVQLYDLSGAVTFNLTNVTGSQVNNVRITNRSTETISNLTVTNCDFSTNNATNGNTLFLLEIHGGTLTTGNISNSTFSGSKGTGLNITTANAGTSSGTISNLVVGGAVGSGNTFSNSNNHIDIDTSQDSNLTVKVQNNGSAGTPMTGSASHAINFFTAPATTSGSLNARVEGNYVGNVGSAGSGSTTGNGIRVNMNGATNSKVLLNGNMVRQCPNGRGIEVIGRNGSGNLDVTLTNNDCNPNDTSGFPLAGIFVQSHETAVGSSTHFKVRSDIRGNTVPAGVPSGELVGGYIALLESQASGNSSQHELVGSGATTSAYLAANNTGSAAANAGVSFIAGPINTPPLLFAQGGVEHSVEADVSPVVAAADTAAPVIVNTVRAPVSAAAATQRTRTVLEQSQLDSLVAAATKRWEASGLTLEQKVILKGLAFEASDLPGARLGEAGGNLIRVGRDPGGDGWFIDPSPMSDEAFSSEVIGTRRYTAPDHAAAGRIDLLTTLMHEMGHALGLEDSYAAADRDNLMYGFLTKGERRLPAVGQAIGAKPHEDGVSHFLTSSVSIGALPAGKKVAVIYSVTVDAGISTSSISSQGSVSGSNFATASTQDTGVGSPGSGPTVTLIGVPPVITSANATTFKVGTAGSFSFTATGIPGPITFSTLSTLPSGVTLASNGTLSGTPAAGSGGVYTLSVTATNAVSPDATQTFTLTVNEAPVITSANSTTFTAGSAGTFTVTTGHIYPTAVTLSSTGTLPSGVTFTDNGNGTATLAGTPSASAGGSYPLSITANNGITPNGTQSFTLTVNQAPAITSANATTFTVGSAGSFTVTTTGFPNAAISKTGTLPGGVTLTDNGNGTATLSGTPNAGTGGTYSLTISASNGVGSTANQSFTLTVNQAPAITSANATAFSVGSAGSFTVTTTGFPSGATMVIGGTGTLPSGVTFVDNGNGTATLSGTPAAATGGTYPLTITANNGVGTQASQSFTLTVNQAPAITSADNTAFTATIAGSFTVTTTGFPSGATMVIGETGSLPSGVTFVDNHDGTATLSGTPGSLTAGTYPLTITANNGVSPAASQSFTLLVKPPVDHFTVSAPANATAGTAVNVTVTALDASNAPVPNYQGTVHFTSTDVQAGLPANYTFTAGDNGSHTFSVTLKTAGTQTVSVNDTVTTSAAGTSGNITVGAGADAKLVFVVQPSTTVAGVAISPAVTVQVQDAYGNNTTGTPNVTVALGNAGVATLGGTLTNAAVGGVATFNNLTVDKVGTTYNLGATSGALTGATSNNFTITPAAATHYAVSAPGSATAGTAFNVTVTALDAFNNTATGYAGTVHFTSSDAAATLPADGTLTSGVGTFSATLKTAGSRTITATDTVTGSITGTSNSITVGAGADAKLVFVQQPSTTVAGVSITPAVTVQIQDTFGNPTASTSNVTVALGNAGSATLSGTLTKAAVAGVATFNNLSVDKVGTTYNLGATSGALTGATSNNFTITPAAATHYTVSAPGSATAGTAFNVTVTALDAFNNTATGYAGTVHFTSSDAAATLPADGTLTSGVGTFSATLRTAGSRTITATDTVTGSITGTSSGITVTAGADAKLAFVQQPSTTVAGVSITPVVTVQIQDTFGNPTASTANVTVALGNAGGATLSGTLTKAAVAGVATFNNLSVDKVGTTYNLGATSGALTGATSNNFTITPAAATHYTVSAPGSATAGTAFNVTVTALDQFNNTATGYAGTVHFTSSDAAATLPADTTLTSGVGTFSATLRTAGSRTITATDTVTGSITGTSASITVNPAAATHYAVSAPGSATAGTAFNVTVTALDQFNNTATGYAGTVHFTSSDAQAVLPANSTLTSGVGTFSATLKTAGSRTITATDTVTGSITGTSAGITVTAGADAKLVFVQQPSTTVAGVSIAPAVTVQIQDTFGNPTSSTSNVTVALGNAGGATLSGTLTKAAVAGVATFNNLSVDKVGTTYNLGATSGALTGATSNNFTITPAAATHYTVSAPANATAGTAFNVTVTALDQFNNTATGYAGTVHFTSSDAPATLPANSTLTNGVGTFSATLKTGGNQTITATDTVTSSITGTSGNINVDPRSDLAVTVTDSPDPVFAGNNITYTINVVNNGPSAAASVSLSDTLPAGTTFVSFTAPGGWTPSTPAINGTGTVTVTKSSVAPAETASFTLVVKVAASVLSGTVISDTASITTSTTELNTGNNSATTTTTVTANADLAVTVTDAPDPVTAGQNLTYTISYANAGPSDAATVTVSDTLPAGTTFVSSTSPGGWSATTPVVGSAGTVTFTSASIASGGSGLFTIVVKVAPSVASGTVISNTATITSASTDPNSGNNSATATTTVTRSADLALTATATPDPVNATQNATYTIDVINNGPSDAANALVTFPFPANVTFVSASTPAGWTKTSTNNVGDATGTVTYTATSVAASATAQFVVVLKVNATAPNNSHLDNTITVSAVTTDPTPGNNSASPSPLVKSGADLAISGSASTPAVAGSDITYTFTATNNGPLDADSAVVTSVLPVGTTFVSAVTPSGWTLAGSSPAVGSNGTVTFTRPLLANGATADFTVVAHINANVASGTALHNGIAAASSTLDIFPLNSSASLDSTVVTRADLAVTLVGAPDPVLANDNLTYTITVANNGPSDATGVSVSLPLASSTTFTSATGAGWSISSPAVDSTGTVTFSGGAITHGSSAILTVVTTVASGTSNGSTISATATASGGSDLDPNLGNNSATETVEVGTVDPTVLQLATTGTLNRQTGLFELNVKVTNTTPHAINGFRLHVDYSAYLAAFPSLRLWNATSLTPSPYVDYPYPVAIDGVVNVKLVFYTSTRTFPVQFSPILTVEKLPTSQTSDTNGAGVQATAKKLLDGTVLIEFPSVVGHWYRVRYSSDMVHWNDCPVPLQAGGSKTQWIDSGAPFTNISPADPSVTSRFYIVNEIPAP